MKGEKIQSIHDFIEEELIRLGDILQSQDNTKQIFHYLKQL